MSFRIGENTKLNAGGLVTFGYTGDYGNEIPSSHGLTWGLDGTVSGYYYNPNFISFHATPYYNQSRANSSYQSLTGASGINASANFFTGSHFPGSVNYHYDRNSSGTFRHCRTAQLHHRWQGTRIRYQLERVDAEPANAFGRIFTRRRQRNNLWNETSRRSSSSKLFNIRSGYEIAGFRLNAFLRPQ